MKLRTIVVSVVAILFTVSGARAETLYANLSGAQEVPVVSTNATGYARIVINESALTITYTVVFSGLSSAQTASHIHAPGAIGATAAVAINFSAVGGTSGTISGTAPITATQIAQLRAHLGYVNVHSTIFSGGEIRGQLGNRRPVDFDGDGRTDFSILRFPSATPPTPAPITYYNMNSTTGFQSVQWGDANYDYPAPGDYDGDFKDDFCLYRNSPTGFQAYFLILRSSDFVFQQIAWGAVGDTPVARDYDGDGRTDAATYRQAAVAGGQSYFYILQSSGSQLYVPWGTTGVDSTQDRDIPVPADYDGDGKCDVAVYRSGALSPANTFIIRRSSDGVATFQQWGNFASDYILPGDYDGDGKADFAAARTGALASSPLVWYILQSSNGQVRYQTFGVSDDLPVQGDYDGDGRTDPAVYRRGATTSSQSFTYVLQSLSGSVLYMPWGVRADFPVNTFDAR
ncbi:MAG: CHRD domain-containing protein [Acidobacteriota bacterium]